MSSSRACGLNGAMREEDEPAFRAVPAPPDARVALLERRVAAGHHLVVGGGSGRTAGDVQLRQAAQQREVRARPAGVRVQRVAEQHLGRQPLGPLVVDVVAAPDEVGHRSRALVGHHDRAEAVQDAPWRPRSAS